MQNDNYFDTCAKQEYLSSEDQMQEEQGNGEQNKQMQINYKICSYKTILNTPSNIPIIYSNIDIKNTTQCGYKIINNKTLNQSTTQKHKNFDHYFNKVFLVDFSLLFKAYSNKDLSNIDVISSYMSQQKIELLLKNTNYKQEKIRIKEGNQGILFEKVSQIFLLYLNNTKLNKSLNSFRQQFSNYQKNNLSVRISKKSNQNYNNQSKYHNLKKSFMHMIIQIFQEDILQCFNLPVQNIEYILKIIKRMRLNSIKFRPVKGQYEYYTHLHYTALLLKITPENMHAILKSDKDLKLHEIIFQEKIQSSNYYDQSILKCNYYKEIIGQIIIKSINILDTNGYLQKSNDKLYLDRFDYMLKAKKAIKQLQKGIQILRF